jgi:SAM-dependent methyltransferase
MNPSKHLDLGCGSAPRNPFNQRSLFGVDIVEPEKLKFTSKNFLYKQANIIEDGIPFDDCYFDSVSAYDFLEHIPRNIAGSEKMQFPFIDLIAEIHRVLIEGGRFYALTPFYPHAAAFTDPTHVNFITEDTHKYFCKPHVWAEKYGYRGEFTLSKCRKVNIMNELEDTASQRMRIRSLVKKGYRLMRGGRTHLLWVFIK